ncbi:squalene/phytoene synthase family protein [Donghicola sp. C2-DW-16]|uniref:Squalene/phytoene synthase family protein n=1 Tax=Donghicola mangrovi TaxID=2729614 RepID=A0ABX2PEI3_9RHOB|nr:squalene/phytoene synthase family protein [Donghicola mangrovi]NVO27915.1 squalene/phytoene synthase family protein [Donghicola mangrovi]
MSINACAKIVHDADPDRFLAIMAAPVPARRVLFPLYAFNVEISRAPWVTKEPMIAEMRVQWWRDALAEVAEGRGRRHEVVDALAEVLDAEGARLLDGCCEMRRWDIYTDPFEDEAHFDSYIGETSGTLMWVAARALGSVTEDAVRARGYAAGVANWLMAVPELESRNRVPLLDGRPEGVQALARKALGALDNGDKADKAARPALLPAFQSGDILRQALDNPLRVVDGNLGLSPIRKRLLLMKQSAFG